MVPAFRIQKGSLTVILSDADGGVSKAAIPDLGQRDYISWENQKFIY